MDDETFGEVMRGLNSLYARAEEIGFGNVRDGLLAFLTFNLSRIFLKTHYDSVRLNNGVHVY
jgi:hypothetical protein